MVIFVSALEKENHVGGPHLLCYSRSTFINFNTMLLNHYFVHQLEAFVEL